MSDESGFLAAIKEQPAERSTRLVYADWLDEHDRHDEAAFLRLQIEIAERSARLLDLGGRLDAKWLAAVGNVPTKAEDFNTHTGRWLSLQALRQWNVYEGLLEGLPTAERNPRIVQAIVTAERDRNQREPYLIPPVERPIKRADYPFGTPSALPAVGCVARFTSFQPARDSARDASELVIIWFQDEWAFPIDPAIREHIRAIEWDKHAHDFDW